MKLIGYVDSDWDGDVEARTSTSGYAFYLGLTIFFGSSKKQHVVALLTAKAECIAAANCATQAIWLRGASEFFYNISRKHLQIFHVITSQQFHYPRILFFMVVASALISSITKSESWLQKNKLMSIAQVYVKLQIF